MASLLSVVRHNAYYDSVKLMRVSEELSRQPGVLRAAVVMATPLNVELLVADGLAAADATVSPEDVLIAISAQDDTAAENAMARLDDLLRARVLPEDAARLPARTLEEASGRNGANLAVIAVPGPFAALEALAALRRGMHVFLFSDNVPLEAEVHLKSLAAELDLLMMGPDCGTAILGGTGLGFANRVRPGPVGIAGASGTGIQQVCCLLDASGVGIAEAIGTGGRDLSAAVGGSMTIRAARMLDADERVEIIAVISKPADAAIANRLHGELLALSKPVVACLLGETLPGEGNVEYVATLTEVASAICRHLGVRSMESPSDLPLPGSEFGDSIYGLYAGGTLCSEAGRVLDAAGVRHNLIDLGDDEYTRGRAHPIIDTRLRASMLAGLADRHDMGAVLLDVILGDLAHPDPAATLIPAVRDLWERLGTMIPIYVSLIGTQADPQGLDRQREALVQMGIAVFDSNVAASQAAALRVRGET